MEESAFSKNLRAMRESRGYTQEKLAELLGVTEATVYNWERGAIGRPRQSEPVKRLRDLFGVSDTDLFGYNDGYYARAYGLPSAAMLAKTPRKARAPLLGRIHAGDAQEPVVLDAEMPIPYDVWEHHKNGYFLEVKGSCMNKVYPEGCCVLVDPDLEPQSGSIAVVSIDGSDYVMRRLYRGQNSLMLVAQSYDDHEDIIVSGEHEVKLVGTVVWYQSRSELE